MAAKLISIQSLTVVGTEDEMSRLAAVLASGNATAVKIERMVFVSPGSVEALKALAPVVASMGAHRPPSRSIFE